MSKLRIQLIKSPIGYKSDQRATALALGLRKIRTVVEKEDLPQIRGMIKKIRHLVKVEEL